MILAGMPSPFPSCTLLPLCRPPLWWAVVALLVAGLALLTPPAYADSIPVKSAELRAIDGEVVLNAEFDFVFNPTLEDALQNGIPLYFVLDIELSRARWWWLDEKVVQTTLTYRVSYNALTRQYRVASGLLSQSYGSLDEVQRYIGRITSRPVIRLDALTSGARYDAAVRLRLDVNQLPKPFQVNALASREWTLASEWQRFIFVAP
ncbi:MAG: DUF4390 domain-containing protein [Casimicrobiaceae bacterium]